MERRKHKRISLPIPVRIQVNLPENPEVFWDNLGVMQNICFEGVYFRSNGPPPLEQGQIGDFTIIAVQVPLLSPAPVFLSGTGRVVRIDPPSAGSQDIGVALELISAKLFDCLIKTS